MKKKCKHLMSYNKDFYWCIKCGHREYAETPLNQSIEAAVKGEKEPTLAKVIEVYLDLPWYDQLKIVRHIFADEIETSESKQFEINGKFFKKYKADYGTSVNPLLNTIEGCGFKIDRPEQSNPVNDAKEEESFGLSAYRYFRENVGDEFDGDVYYKGTIDDVVSLMKGFYKWRATHPIENKEGVKYNSIEPTSHKTELEKYAPIRQADIARDKDYSPIHDAIMSAIWDRLKEHCGEAINPVWTSSLFPERLTKQCLRIFESLAAQFTPIEQGKRMVEQWISVEDRLPEFETPVLVYTIDGYTQNAWLVVNTDIWHGIGQWKHPKVTYWMPLPSPPLI